MDLDLDELLTLIERIFNRANDYYVNVNEELQEMYDLSRELIEMKYSANRSSIEELLSSLQEYTREMQASYCLEKQDFNSEISKDLMNKISITETKLTDSMNKIQDYGINSLNLVDKISQVQVYQLLTNVDFCYDEGVVAGYAKNKSNKNMIPFSFDNKDSKQKITNELYKIIDEI